MGIFSKSKKVAVTITYIQIIAQTIITLFLTRFYIRELGTDTYGLYQMIYAVAQYILILDLGISITMVRFISEFEAKGEKEKTENFAFHFMIIVFVLLVVVIIIGAIINNNIERIYTKLSIDEYNLAHEMFIVMIIQIGFTIVSHFLQGIALAYEHYPFVKFVMLIQVIVGAILSVLFVIFGMGVKGIVRANTIVIILSTLVLLLYDFVGLRFRIAFHGLDMKLLLPAFVLMVAMLLQSIVGYANNSVDKTLLGIMATKTDVTIYSIAATFITLFNALPTAISTVFQPKATQMVVASASKEELTDLVIKPGRIQLMVVAGFIGGFILFGRDFIICWTGEKTVDAWLYVLLILIPNMIPLIQNTCLSILNAMDKRIYRSLILVAITVFNIILSIFLIKLLGPVGAPLATGISYIVGHCLLMNIYYHTKIGLNVKRMFKEIFSGTWIALISAIIFNLPLILWQVKGNWFVVITKAIVFCIVYSIFLWYFGINKIEKDYIKSFFVRIIRKIRS